MEKPRKTSAALRNVTTATASRSARLGLRSSEAQLAVLRRAADAAHKSLTDFILDSACLAAEQTLLDQRLFMANSKDYQTFLDLLDRPARSNAGLKDLFSRQAPWDRDERAVQARPAARKASAKKPAHA
jgi:uncharacterized protein (DUF1778 family)